MAADRSAGEYANVAHREGLGIALLMCTYLARFFTAAAASGMVRLSAFALAFCATVASAQPCKVTGLNPASPQLPAATLGQPYAVRFTAVGSFGFLGCRLFWFGSPGCFTGSGLTFQNNGDDTASLSGTPAKLGNYSCTVIVDYDDGGSFRKIYTLVVVSPCTPTRITSGAPPPATEGMPYQFTVTATGKKLSFSATGLPPGLTIDPRTGAIAGTPSAVGSYPASIRVKGSCGPAVEEALTFVVAAPPPPPPAAVTLTLASQPNPALFGQPIAVLAQATGGTTVPTGSVRLCVIAPGQYCPPPLGTPPAGTDPSLIPPLLTAPLDGNGRAAYTLTGLLIQDFVLQAYYGGDATHLAATSEPPLDQYVIKGVVLPHVVRPDQPDPPAAVIPTLSWTGLALLALAIAGVVAARVRRSARRG